MPRWDGTPKCPQIDDAPGLTWRYRKRIGWDARWRAPLGAYKRGYSPKSLTVWQGFELDAAAVALIQQRCQTAHSEALLWLERGGNPEEKAKVQPFSGTLGSLIECYQTDADSTYQKLRTDTRRNYDNRLKRISIAYGRVRIKDIRPRQVLQWHKEWKGPDGVFIDSAHTMVSLVRTVFRFGATLLEDADCLRVCGLLSEMRFQGGKPRSSAMTAEQAIALRKAAHEAGWHSIALAQAIQFECTLRQKDVIGEWVPLSATEGGLSEITDGADKWIRGIRWSEIDAMVLRHVTSKKQKPVTIDLRFAPMVLEELQGLAELPKSGPIIVNDKTGKPWRRSCWRVTWRKMARKAGIPDSVFNMDSRAGAITEATLAGAPLEHVRHAAAHSQVSQTADYARGQEEKIAKVMRLRVEHRNKTEK